MKAVKTMTDGTAPLDQAALDRIARLQQRRQPRAAADAPAPRPASGRRRHAAIGGRIAAAGVGASAILGLTAVLALDAAANSNGGSSAELALAPQAAPLSVTPIAGVPEVISADRADISALLTGLADLPDGAIITGALSESGRPIVVVVHPATTTGESAGTAAASAVAPASAPTAVAAPTQLTATPVVREVRVPAAAPAPAPVATTRAS